MVPAAHARLVRTTAREARLGSLTRATMVEPTARPPPKAPVMRPKPRSAAVEDFDGVFGDEREDGEAEEVCGDEHGDEPWQWLGYGRCCGGRS